MSCNDVQQHSPLIIGLCHVNFSRQLEVIPADYAVLDQSVAAFADLLISLFGVFQTNWISKYRKSHYRFGTIMQLAPVSGEIEAVGVVNQPVEDGVSECGVADGLMPLIDWQLAGDDGGAAALTVFEQIARLRGGQDGQAPVVQDQDLGAFDGFRDAGMLAITPGDGQCLEKPGNAVIHHAPVVSAGLVAKRTGNPTFPKPVEPVISKFSCQSIQPPSMRCPMTDLSMPRGLRMSMSSTHAACRSAANLSRVASFLTASDC